MSFPGFLIPYLIGILPGGMLALAGKITVYCLFQRAAGKGKIVLAALALHFLSTIVAIAASLVLLPQHAFGWKTHQGVYFLYAAVWSIMIESACLWALARKWPLKQIGGTVVVANGVYYLGLVLGVAVFSGVQGLTRIE